MAFSNTSYILLLGIQVSADDLLCNHHMAIYTTHYTDNQVVNFACFDPLKRHKTLMTKNLTCITTAIKSKLGVSHVPCHLQQGICRNCVPKLHQLNEVRRSRNKTEWCWLWTTADKRCSKSVSGSIKWVYYKFHINCKTRYSTIKLSIYQNYQSIKLSIDRRASYVTDKVERVKYQLQDELEQILQVKPATSHTQTDEYHQLIDNIVRKIKSSTHREQVKFFTLLPDSWSRMKVIQVCQVSERQGKEARHAKASFGVLPEIPKSIKGNHQMSTEIIENIQLFYRENDMVRIMPGAKQVVACRNDDGFKTYDLKLCSYV